MYTILVTGGCGYIGSHACLTLLFSGIKVVILDSNISSKEKVLKRIVKIGAKKKLDFKKQLFFVKGDIRDENLLQEIFSNFHLKNMPINAVMHFAGLKAVKDSVINPLMYWDINVNGSLKLFKVMEENNCNTIVFSSSATVYDSKKETFFKEDSATNPINPYGQTKLAIEKILRNIYDSNKKNWRIANLRYFNPIGAHESGMIGESPLAKPNNLFPLICRVASGEEKQLRIFGNNWPTHDGTCVRDYIHVMDIAEAHISTLDYLFKQNYKCINLNLGTGKGTSVLELIKIFNKVNNCRINYSFSERRLGDSAVLVANNELASLKLNWTPKRSIEDMCRDGWRWQKLNQTG